MSEPRAESKDERRPPPPLLSPFRPVPAWQRALRASAGILSVLVHVAGAGVLVLKPEAAQKAATWVEMTVVEPKPPPPPPPPEPEKPPEPPKPEKKKVAPKEIKFEEIKPPEPQPAPEAAPPPERVVRRVQGLSASSFAAGGTTGLTVRAGNTTTVAAGPETMSLDEAKGPWVPRPYSSVTEAPKLKWQPPALVVPDEAKQAKAQGVVEVKLDVGPDGSVLKVVVVKDLGFGTGAACVDAWRQSKWKPGEVDGQAVAVAGIPKICTIRPEE